MQLAKHYIDGAWIESVAGQGRQGLSHNPATSEPAARFADGGIDEAHAAIDAARRAFEQPSWRRSPRLRADVLWDFAVRLEARKDEIADWLVTLNGKLRREALGEILAGVSELKYYAGLARNLFGRIIEVEPGCHASLRREAAGVAAIILPWNAPITLRWCVRARARPGRRLRPDGDQAGFPDRAGAQSGAGMPDGRSAPAHRAIVNSVIESGSAVSQALVRIAGRRRRQLYRIHRGRQEDRRRGRRHAEAAAARTGRQGTRPGLRGRRVRRDRQGHHRRQPDPGRPAMHRHQPRSRGRQRLRRFRGGWPMPFARCGWARAATRNRRWAA